MVVAGSGGPAEAGGGVGPHGRRFERIASFSVYRNNTDRSDVTVAEIVDVTEDGSMLVYTDSELEQLGFVDITDPADPTPAGTLGLHAEPTSVAVAGDLALVSVDADEPYLGVVDLSLAAPDLVESIPLAGQPDAVKVSPDGRYAVVVIENERDEDVVVDGVEGGLPQSPAGLLQIVGLTGPPASWPVRNVALTGLAAYGSSDPEPEFVDINRANQAVVTLQENNHLVVVDLRRATVVSSFSAGAVDLEGIDTVEDGRIQLDGSLEDVPREPDGVAWIDNDRFVTANEGDLFGGSRGFSIFDRRGRVRFDSGNSFEHLAVQYGHYPEDRSENKGAEPEGVAVARYGADELLFVGSERGNFVAVYRLKGAAEPEFVQLLPTAIGPEGLLPIPERNLFVATSEEDDPTFGVRTAISIFRLRPGTGGTTDIVSAVVDDAPLPWGALSGLAADPTDPTLVHAVWDSFYSGDPRIFHMDVASSPAVITGSTAIVGGSGDYDAEGIALAPDGTTWIASEGNASDSRPNRLLQVDADGHVVREIGLPAEVVACRAASTARGSLGSGFEGVTIAPADGGGYTVLVAQQRGWNYTTPGCDDLDDDPLDVDDVEPAWTRVWTLDPATESWSHIPYELEPVPANASWVGLSEITALPDGNVGFIERDNRSGDWAELKTLVSVDLDDSVVRADKTSFDLIPSLGATNGWFTDKPECFTVTSSGDVFVVTDNDGVDGATGETQLLRLGSWGELLG